MKKPKKIADSVKDFFNIIDEKIDSGQYVLTPHAQQRAIERRLPLEDILNLLQGKSGYSRQWIKGKDEFKQTYIDEPPAWFYRVEGTTPDKVKMRIIITFDDQQMPIITVIRL